MIMTNTEGEDKNTDNHDMLKCRQTLSVKFKHKQATSVKMLTNICCEVETLTSIKCKNVDKHQVQNQNADKYQVLKHWQTMSKQYQLSKHWQVSNVDKCGWWWWLFPHVRGFWENVWQFIPHLHFFFLKVEISLRTLIPLFKPGSVHSGSVSWDDCDQVLPDKCG